MLLLLPGPVTASEELCSHDPRQSRWPERDSCRPSVWDGEILVGLDGPCTAVTAPCARQPSMDLYFQILLTAGRDGLSRSCSLIFHNQTMSCPHCPALWFLQHRT